MTAENRQGDTHAIDGRSAESYLTRTSELVDGLKGCLPWHSAGRLQSLNRLSQLGLPLTFDEHWKYSRLNDHLAATDSHGLDPGLTQTTVDFEDALTIEVVGNRIDATELPDGLTIRAFTQVDETFLMRYLNQNIDDTRYPLALLNDALLQSGLLVHVEKGYRIETPINLIFKPDQNSASGEVYLRVLVVLEQDSYLQLIEQRNHTPERLNVVRECSLADKAELKYSQLQQPHQSRVWNLTTAELKNSSRFELNLLGLGGFRQRNEANVRLSGTECSSDIHCMLYASDREKLDTQINVEHLGTDACSRQLIRSMAADRSEITINGRIHIHPNAQRTDARLSNANLLLDEGARVNTKPELEIYADDVQCSHGATVGQLDEEQIFYLRSRGLSEDQARTILSLSFMQSSMEDKRMRQAADELLGKLLRA